MLSTGHARHSLALLLILYPPEVLYTGQIYLLVGHRLKRSRCDVLSPHSRSAREGSGCTLVSGGAHQHSRQEVFISRFMDTSSHGAWES